MTPARATAVRSLQGGNAASVRFLAALAAWLLVTAVLVTEVQAAFPAPGTTERISLPDLGRLPGEGNGPSLDTSVSADGRYVAFSSAATNLVDALDGNGQSDVFLRDRLTGATTLVSVASHEAVARPGLLPGLVGGANSLLGRNGVAPAAEATRTASGVSTEPSISADGRFVAFTSSAPDLVDIEQQHTSGVFTDMFVRDLVEGTTRLVSFSDRGDGERAAEGGAHPAISADGRWVAFSSPAQRLGTMESTCPAGAICGQTWDVHVWDRLTHKMDLVSAPVNGTADSARDEPPDISAEGRFVAFESLAEDLVADDTNGAMDVFVSDRGDVDQEPETIVRVSVGSDGAQLEEPSAQASISDDGRRVAFLSAADADGADGNALPDVYLRDRDADDNGLFAEQPEGASTTTRVSRGIADAGSDGPSVNPAVSGDGAWVAWASMATNQVEGDGDLCTSRVHSGDDNFLLVQRTCVDVFVREVATGAVELVSLDTGGGQGNGDSKRPSVSFAGEVIGYDSSATNLVAGDANGFEDAFVRARLPRLVVAPGTGDFGDTVVGQSSSIVFTATNVGAGRLVVSAADLVGPDSGAFVMTADGCAGRSLGHGETCTVTVTFAPTALGDRSAELVVASDLGGDPQRVALTGRGTVPAIEVIPDPGDFGSQPSGSSNSVTFTARSVGSAPLAISDVAVTPGAVEFVEEDDACAGRTLAPNETCTVTVSFSPTGPGERVSTLVFVDGAPGSPHVVPLRGVGVGELREAAIIVAPDPGDFGPVLPGASRTLRFTAISAGEAPLSIFAISVEDEATGSFSQVDGSANCPTVAMVMGNFCTVDVEFSPSDTGSFTGQLVFSDSAPGSPHRVALSGLGQEPQVTLDPPLGPAGSVTKVTGTGFRPEVEVSLRWEPGIGQAKTATDTRGSFETFMLIMPGDRLGPRQLVAEDGVLIATADLLVVPGSTEARHFVTRE